MRFSELEGARIGVWGAGREIASFAAQLRARLPGARLEVAVFDRPPGDGELAVLGEPAPRIAGPGDAAEALAGCSVLVRSPGVSIHRPELAATRRSQSPPRRRCGSPSAGDAGCWA